MTFQDIADEARRWSAFRSNADGQDALVRFAEWIEQQAAAQTAEPAPEAAQ